MTLAESLVWLFSTQQFGIKLGLENTHRLLEALGAPQENLRFIHVAGTNGKGSVCAMLDAILRAAGFRTGLYTSPHLVEFRERIRVDGEKISPAAAAEGLTLIRSISDNWDHSPTFFEITTALALWHFAQRNCDWVVLETGMGGRLDATNAIRPVVSVITPIAMDHSQWLGDSLVKIAAEKAGIIKNGVPVVSANQEPEVEKVLETAAADKRAPLRFVVDRWEGVEPGLSGPHQKQNAALAVTALEAAGLQLDGDFIPNGFRDVCWPGRFQIIGNRIVLDGSHNPHAARHLVQTWQDKFGTHRGTVIFGALADKDYASMLEILEPITEEFLFVPVLNERGAPPQLLTEGINARHQIYDSLQTAMEASSGLTLITGSLFLVGEALQILGQEI